jgi:hypothetical protein
LIAQFDRGGLGDPDPDPDPIPDPLNTHRRGRSLLEKGNVHEAIDVPQEVVAFPCVAPGRVRPALIQAGDR